MTIKNKNLSVKDVSKSRTYSVGRAIEYMLAQPARAISLREIREACDLNPIEMQMLRREINRINDSPEGKLKYLRPVDHRYVFLLKEKSTSFDLDVNLAVESAVLNLDVPINKMIYFKESLSNHIKSLLVEDR